MRNKPVHGRDELIQRLLEVTTELVIELTDREELEPDFISAREAADNLQEELRAL